MERYITRRYVAACWADALRLAQLDGAALQDIRCQQNVDLIHRTDWWAWWSDEQLTTAIGLSEDLQPKGLSADAISLMDQVWMGRAIAPQCGWALLASVKQIVSCARIQLVRERDAFRCHDKLTLRFTDGEERVLHRYETLSKGVYQCDIATEST